MGSSAIEPSDYSILICDDDDSIRTFLNSVVGEWGFKVDVVASGEDALLHFEEKGAPDVLLTDINMGGMSGVDLARESKQRAQRTEVIMMTAQASFETAVTAMRIGVFDYLCKPFDDMDDIKHTLLHVCERIYFRIRNEFLVRELARKHREIESLARMSKELAESRDLTKVIQIGCEGLSRAFGECPVAFFQYLPAQSALIGAVRHPSQLFGGARPSRIVPERYANDRAALVQYFNNVTQDSVFFEQIFKTQQNNGKGLRLDPGGAWKSVALVTRNTPRGLFILHMQNSEDAASTDLLQRHIQTLSTGFENAVLHAKLVDSSIRDGLTGLWNVRHMRERLETEILRAARLQHPLSLLFLDVDHFKHYNDANGHQAGDEVLRILSRMMQQSFRTTDLCARYGGEEFCIVMPDTCVMDAMVKAEKFRAIVEKKPFLKEETQPLGRLSISIGVSEYPSHGSSVESLIEVADAALYEAKRPRNTVVCGTAPEGHEAPFTSQRVPSGRSESPHSRRWTD